MMSKLLIDTHKSKCFSLAAYKNGLLQIEHGLDASSEMIQLIDKLTSNQITEVHFISGPGSLTGLRIGASVAQGIAIAKNIPIKAFKLWDLLMNEYPDADIFFYTGTKKWIKKNKLEELILEIDEIEKMESQNFWICNNPEKLIYTKLKKEKNIPYPNLPELMHKYANLATNDLNLLYPVTNFITE